MTTLDPTISVDHTSSVEAEKRLLGCLLMDDTGVVYDQCKLSHVESDTFFDSKHKAVWDVIDDMASASQPVDSSTLAVALADASPTTYEHHIGSKLANSYNNLFEAFGGYPFVDSLVDSIGTHIHWRHWLEIVIDKWRMRRLAKLSVGIKSMILTPDKTSDDVVAFIESSVSNVVTDNNESSSAVSTIIDKRVEELIKIQSGELSNMGMRFGLTDLEKALRGLHEGNLVTIAARPSMGKSALSGNIVESAACDFGVPCAVLSYEMSKTEYMDRMIFSRAKIGIDRWKDGMYRGDDRAQKRIRSAQQALKQAKIIIDEASGSNVFGIMAKARMLKRKYGVKILVVDYVQLVSPTNSTKSNREQQVAEISRNLKTLAGELGMCVIAVAQLNRESVKKGRRPSLVDLRESGAIEQDSNVVLLLDAEEPGSQRPSGKMILTIAKNRNGAVGGEIPLTFIPEYVRFENYIAQP